MEKLIINLDTKSADKTKGLLVFFAYLAVVAGIISHFALNRFLCVVIAGERLTFWLLLDNNDDG